MRLSVLALMFMPIASVRAQWVSQQSGTDAEFRGLVALSPTVVWASGTRNRVVHSTDGGRTWKLDTTDRKSVV